MSAHDDIRSDPIAGEGDTRTDPYYTQLRISALVDGQVTNP